MKHIIYLIMLMLICFSTSAQRPSQKLRMLNDKALKFKQAGLYDQAAHMYNRMGSIIDSLATKGPVNPILISAYAVNWSDVYIRTGQYQSAIDLITRYCSNLNNPKVSANLASAYFYLKKYQESEKILDSMIKVAPKGSQEYNFALGCRGYLYFYKGEYSKASTDFYGAIASMNDDENRYLLKANLSICESCVGNHSKAIQLIDECLREQQNLIGENHPDYIISLRKRAEILLNAQRSDALYAYKRFFYASKNEIVSSMSSMNKVAQQNFWNSRKIGISKCFALEESDPEFINDVILFSKSMSMNLIKTDTAKTKTDNIRKELNNNSIAVEFIQYLKNDTSKIAALITKSKGKTIFVPLFNESYLNNYTIKGNSMFGTLSECVYSTADIDKDNLYSDEVLGNMIWGPILKYCNGVKNIYFSPDGIFHLLAIESMPISQKKYISDNYNLYRLTTTAQLLNDKTSLNFKTDKFLLIGGLDYYDNSKVTEIEDADRSGSLILHQKGYPPAVNNVENLPGSDLEISKVKAILKSSSVDVFTVNEATETSIKSCLGDYNVILFSTHGYCINYQSLDKNLFYQDSLSEDKSLSHCGILFSGTNKMAVRDVLNRNYDDGICTGREFSQLDLNNVKLIVLSACQTALGRVSSDGIAGLPRGLKEAGVKTIIASLWEVNDQATMYLMDNFWKNAVKGMSVHDAMIKAQRKLRMSKELNSAHYWAPFIVIDDI